MNRRLTVSSIRQFRKTVYGHFSRYGRELPWRRDFNPYHIFVSEVMLQQTQVDRVAEKFDPFIAALPSFHALAHAPLAKVLRLWQGLGYNRRALNLKRAAELVEKEYNCRLPSSPEILETLPGIGKATAASIAAFAFNRPVVFLETNIRTVLIHHFFSDCSCTGVAADSLTHGWSPALQAPPMFVREPRPPLSAHPLKKNTGTITDKELLPVTEMVLDRKNPRRWYSALMDYGAMLKKRYGNASRRSAHYKTQSRFEGSRRQKRGRILRLLLDKGPLASGAISRRLAIPVNLVNELCAELTADAIIINAKKRYRIA